MGLIRYSCGPIWGPHELVHVKKFCVRVFHHVLLKYGHEKTEMQKQKFDDVTLRWSITQEQLGRRNF